MDIILGVGGGSSIDVAKAISVGVTHDGETWDYRVIDGKPIEDKLLPIIAVTTTAGTGTEVTPVSVITNPAIHLKYALADNFHQGATQFTNLAEPFLRNLFSFIEILLFKFFFHLIIHVNIIVLIFIFSTSMCLVPDAILFDTIKTIIDREG